MPDSVEKQVLFRDLGSQFPGHTHGLLEFVLKRINVHILEMEDVLFHHNSAVMMPSLPEGSSSSDGSDDDASDANDAGTTERQERLSGVLALAVIYKELESDPGKRIVIAGHTDTSGEPDYNFTLSDLRAQAVLSVLAGDHEMWTPVCVERHKIEDYQQIMKHASLTRKWPCDPGACDNAWGPRTKTATQNFIEHYNTAFADKEGFTRLPPGTLGAVESSPEKRWTDKLWEAVYHLYSDDLCQILGLTRTKLDTLRGSIYEHKFVSSAKRYVGCGESFPIDDAEKTNYRSQSNRRVEILLFDKDEMPTVLACPPDRTDVHKERDCPLWNGLHFLPIYIDPGDFYSVMYHMGFKYYDRIKKAVCDVPPGLQIKVFELRATGSKELRAASEYHNGVYNVRVRFNPPMEDKNRTGLYFEFETENQWIYTEDQSKDPVLKKLTAAEITELKKSANAAERQKYYDLPAKWSSRNYWTRLDGDMDKGARFEQVLSKEKKLKPFGEGQTQPSQPLLFSLDDIVLVDAKNRQGINNNTQVAKDLDDSGNPIDLSDQSRITVFFIDEARDNRLIVHEPMTASHPYFSDVAFKENVIHKTKENTRLIIFCSGLYDVTDKRTADVEDFDFGKGHILGARAAMLNDPAVHVGQKIHVNLSPGAAHGAVPANMKDYVKRNIGNYELHYLADCGLLRNKPLAYLMIYWNCRFRAHPTAAIAPVDANWRVNWEKDGMQNSMRRTNRPYLLEMKSGPRDVIIRPFHVYEAKLDGVGGAHKCLVDVSSEDEDWMMPTEAKFFEGSYQDQGGYYGSDAYKDVDGNAYEPLMSHHEHGHATGCLDDYMYSLEFGGDTYGGLPGYDQPYTAEGGPYSVEWLARMNACRIPRMRDFWHFINWVHDEATGKLRAFLDGSRFKLTYTFNKAGVDTTLDLDLDDPKYRDTCEPSYRKNGAGIGGTGKADLLLYRLGGGETAQLLDPNSNPAHVMNPRLVFDGVLAVRTKLAVKFIDDTHAWTKNHQENWLKESLWKPIRKLNRFYLLCASANDFKTTLVLFVPHFAIYTGSAPADSHFNVEVKFFYSGGGAHRRNYSATGKLLRVDNDVDEAEMVRYFFGKAGAGNVEKADLVDLGDWIGGPSVSNGAFTVEEFM